MMMKSKKQTTIGVIADTHIPDESDQIPAQILEDFQSVDVIFHLGDFNDFHSYKILQSIKPVVAVYGNTDELDVRDALPPKRKLEMHGYQIGLTHGWGPPEKIETRVYEKMKHLDLIVFGHSHVPLFTQYNGVYLFNPGSPFLNRSGTGTYGILEVGETIQHRIIELNL